LTPSLYHVYRGTATPHQREERQALKIEPQKPYKVRYRQFKKGRRSTREMTMYGNSTEEVKQQFEEIVTIWASMRMPSISHAQLVSVFPAKEG